MKVSEHTSMIITAFCFMVLMLVITAPVTGPGLREGMAPGPVVGHDIFTESPVPNPSLPVAGPGPDDSPTLALLQDRSGM